MSESDVTSGLTQDQDTGKLTTVASYAQRIFYSGVTSSITGADARSPNYSGYIFFTRVVKSDEDLEKCYQEADPTDPGINDIIASDGGSIQIPEATRIVKIASSQASLNQSGGLKLVRLPSTLGRPIRSPSVICEARRSITGKPIEAAS